MVFWPQPPNRDKGMCCLHLYSCGEEAFVPFLYLPSPATEHPFTQIVICKWNTSMMAAPPFLETNAAFPNYMGNTGNTKNYQSWGEVKLLS